MGPVSRRMTPLNPLWAMAQQVVSQPYPMPGAGKPPATQTSVSGSRNLSGSASATSLSVTNRIGKPVGRALSGAESVPVYATTGLQRMVYGSSEEDALSGRLLHLAQDNAMRAFHFGETISIADILSARLSQPRETARMQAESEFYRTTRTIIDNMGNDKIIRNARGEVITIWKYNFEDGTYRVQTYS